MSILGCVGSGPFIPGASVQVGVLETAQAARLGGEIAPGQYARLGVEP